MPHPVNRPLLSVVINATGGFSKSWQYAPNPRAFTDIEHYERLAGIAHGGTIDSLWMPDVATLGDAGSTPLTVIDPVLLLTAIARTVPDIGLVPTISTTYQHPFPLTRQITTLDLISDGRAGVNAVTSLYGREAVNYGSNAVPSYDDRYERSEEFLEVFAKLATSFEFRSSDVLRAQGLLFDDRYAQPIDHEGKHFKVSGPLPVPHSRQGRPLLSVAGGSEHTKGLAARRADVLYTALVNRDAAIEFTDDVRRGAAAAGRAPGAVKVMPGLSPVIGSTMEEAHRRLDELSELAHDQLDPVDRIAGLLDLDAKDLHPDRQLTREQLTQPEHFSRPLGFWNAITDVAIREQLTVRELARRFQVFIGHNLVVGTPETVADLIIDWWQQGACDGFTIYPLVNTIDIALLADEVIPILREKVGYPKEYDGSTLRQRFGATD